MTNELKGTFQITGWDEAPYLESDNGAKLTRATITQNYTGDIEGSSELEYSMSYQADKTAVFVGFEKITGSIRGKEGCLIIQHSGKFEAGVASSHFTVVSGSGQGELSGIEGKGSFISGENGQANYKLTINA